MLELTWPWVFVLLPLPYLVYRLATRAPRGAARLGRRAHRKKRTVVHFSIN